MVIANWREKKAMGTVKSAHSDYDHQFWKYVHIESITSQVV